MRVKDARGKEVVIKARPVRIVSVAPSNTEILFALALADRIVGVTNYCNYPPQARKKTRVGDMGTSAEAVIALRPDLVVGHAFVNSRVIARLEGLGQTVFAIDPKTISKVERDIRTLGKITARPKTADALAKKMDTEIEAVRVSHKGKPSKRVLVVIQPSPLWAAGPKTFVDEMIKIAGAKNVSFDARPGFVPFSKELAISRDPEVIIVGSKSDAGYFLTSPEWKHTTAVRRKHVHVINPDLLVRPGPRLVKGLREMAKQL
ncbi:MAG: ABC transporter substrate-binding protein [Armatimonadetes bacterium]|nr:ABC transporter substrate-binding protein [Armatimonadota bacterium]